jgi:hypothetical protein
VKTTRCLAFRAWISGHVCSADIGGGLHACRAVKAMPAVKGVASVLFRPSHVSWRDGLCWQSCYEKGWTGVGDSAVTLACVSVLI